MDMQIQALRTQMVEKKQASDTLYYTVREAIATGLLPMGTRLREEDLAEAFDVSRTPVREAMKKLENGELHVFDVSTFTVTGENVTADMKTDAEGHLTSYMADVDNDANMEHDTEGGHDGYFAESEKRSAPYFDIAIDGIVRLDVNFG